MSAIANPREKEKFRIDVYSEQLKISFPFNKKEDAEMFFQAVLQSDAVTAANFFENGIFKGARDGAAG